MVSKIAIASPGTHLTDPVDGRKEGSCSVTSDSLRPHGLYSPWKSPGQNTGVGSLSLLQGDLPNPGIEPRSPTSHCRRILYQLSHLYLIGSRKTLEADPHWSVLSHMSEPITVARARFNTLKLPGKGLPSSSTVSLTK